MGQRKWVDIGAPKKKASINLVDENHNRDKKKIKMRSTCKSHTDDKSKRHCCQTKKSLIQAAKDLQRRAKNGRRSMRKQDNMPARNKKNFRSTKSGAGMTRAGVAAYRRKNPGSKLKTAVTGKVKKGSKAANRRKSYCARSAGQMKKTFLKLRPILIRDFDRHVERWKC